MTKLDLLESSSQRRPLLFAVDTARWEAPRWRKTSCRRHVLLSLAAGAPAFQRISRVAEELLRKFSETSSQGAVPWMDSSHFSRKRAVFYSDGAAKGQLCRSLFTGRRTLLRGFWKAGARLVPKNLVRRFAEINGQPGFVTFLDGRPFSVFTLDVSGEERISRIYVITNPEKLKRIPSSASLPPSLSVPFPATKCHKLPRISVLLIVIKKRKAKIVDCLFVRARGSGAGE